MTSWRAKVRFPVPSDLRRGLPDVLAPALLLSFVVWRFREGAALDVVYSAGDIGSEFAPLRMLGAELLRQGELLSWAPQVLGGYPAAANPHAGTYYPLQWLLALVLSPAGAVNYFTIVSFLLAAGGMYLFLRDLGSSAPAAAAGGLVFSLNGNRIFESYVYIGSVAYFPLLLLALRRAVNEGKLRHYALASLYGGLAWIAGNPQMGYILNGAAVVFVLLEILLRREQIPGGWKRALFALLAATAIGLGLSAVQFLPTLELAAHTPRAAPTWEALVEGSLDPRQLKNVVKGGGIEYLGAIPVALAIAGLLAGRWRRAQAAIPLLGILFLLLAFGRYTPLYRILYEVVPGFGLFRIPFRFFVVVIFAVTTLAAAGFDALTGWAGRVPTGRFRILPLLVGGALLAALVVDYARLPRYHYDPAAATSPAAVASRGPTVQYVERLAGRHRTLALVTRTTIWSRLDEKVRDLHASAPLLTEVESLDGYMPLHYIPYMSVFGNLGPWTGPAKDRLLDFLNVRYVVTDAEYPPGFDRGSLVLERMAPDGLRVFRNPDPLPRALLVPKVSADDDHGGWLQRLAAGEWDPRAVAQVSAGSVVDLSCNVPPSGRARLTFWSRTRLVVETDATCPALLWVLETRYPGWRARVDGEAAPIIPTNLMYRGVRVPAGRHSVEMRFQPGSRSAGAAISILSLVVVCLGIAWRR